MLFLFLLLVQSGGFRCNPSDNQQALNICALDRYQAADRALNAQWRRTWTAAKANPSVRPSAPPNQDNAPYADVLIAAQRAWLTYRAAQCRLESRPSQGGSMEPMVEFGCMARLTRERTASLRKEAEEN